jgi:hypothetical protein
MDGASAAASSHPHRAFSKIGPRFAKGREALRRWENGPRYSGPGPFGAYSRAGMWGNYARIRVKEEHTSHPSQTSKTGRTPWVSFFEAKAQEHGFSGSWLSTTARTVPLATTLVWGRLPNPEVAFLIQFEGKRR